MKPIHRPPTGAVYSYSTVVLSHDMNAWMAAFTFFCNGIPYDYFFVIGKIDLTETQARDIMESQQYAKRAQASFLEDAIIAPIIH